VSFCEAAVIATAGRAMHVRGTEVCQIGTYDMWPPMQLLEGCGLEFVRFSTCFNNSSIRAPSKYHYSTSRHVATSDYFVDGNSCTAV
jgi:hypothetical protein